jgi:hypothetical protein
VRHLFSIYFASLTITGVGKTSLIKSIVQTCEDIVHVDPLPIGKPTALTSSSKGKQVVESPEPCHISEINASTRPYPSWWSEIEDSKVLRRRRSLGDTILDRNLCFVDTENQGDCKAIHDYMTMQLQRAMSASTTANHDFAALMSGSGGSQVDVVFYLLAEGLIPPDKICHLSNRSRYLGCRHRQHESPLTAEQRDSSDIKGRSSFA